MSAVPPAGLESKKELMSEFVDGEFDPNDAKMFKLLGLDVLDEKKPKITADDIKLPVVRGTFCSCGRGMGGGVSTERRWAWIALVVSYD